VEDTATAGLTILSWSGIVQRSEIQRKVGGWLLDVLQKGDKVV
jgi:hypothetical protein